MPPRQASLRRCNCWTRHTKRRLIQRLHINYAITERQSYIMDIRYARYHIPSIATSPPPHFPLSCIYSNTFFQLEVMSQNQLRKTRDPLRERSNHKRGRDGYILYIQRHPSSTYFIQFQNFVRRKSGVVEYLKSKNKKKQKTQKC